MLADEREDFAWLFRDHFASIALAVERTVLDRPLAEDLTEDAFVRLWRHWDTPATRDRPAEWVQRAAERRAARAAGQHRLVAPARRWRPPERHRQGPAVAVDGVRPHVERRLAAVVARQRRRERTALGGVVIPLALVAALLVVGAARGPARPDAGGHHLSRPRAVARDSRPTIPDGRYSTVLGRAELRSAAFPADVGRRLGRDGRLPVTLELFAPYYLVWVTTDAGRFVREDYGTAAYDRSGRVVLTSDGGACPGCAVTYRWSVDGSGLALTFAGGAAGRRDGPAEPLLTPRTFRRGT